MENRLVDKLNIPMMAPINRSPFGTAFTVSIEASTGVSTGISAKDRARTVQVAIDPDSGPMDIISPGHVFPLRAQDGGVLKRTLETGHGKTVPNGSRVRGLLLNLYYLYNYRFIFCVFSSAL